MCAIIDANVADQVFGQNRPEAGVKFFNWINTKGRIIVGGNLLKELNRTSASKWVQEALLAGKTKVVNESDVNTRTEELRNGGECRSDDPHVLALAQVSGARLLYSNDKDLQKDFQNRKLIGSPRGNVYTTNKSKNFSTSHKRLLGKKGLCQAQ